MFCYLPFAFSSPAMLLASSASFASNEAKVRPLQSTSNSTAKKTVSVYPYKVSLKIKGFDMPQLLKICLYIKKMCIICGAHKINMAFLPVKRTHITVCRSPHIHKKSREQFLHKRHKVTLSFCLSNLSALHTGIFFFKTSYLPGVEYELCVLEKAYVVVDTNKIL